MRDNEHITINHRRSSQMMYLLRMVNRDAVSLSYPLKAMNEHVEVIHALEKRGMLASVEGLQRYVKGELHRIYTHWAHALSRLRISKPRRIERCL